MLFAVLALVIVTCAGMVWWRFLVDMALAKARIGSGSMLIETPCGPIEYAEAGAGTSPPGGSWASRSVGHAWVGHDDEVMAAIADLLATAPTRRLP